MGLTAHLNIAGLSWRLAALHCTELMLTSEWLAAQLSLLVHLPMCSPLLTPLSLSCAELTLASVRLAAQLPLLVHLNLFGLRLDSRDALRTLAGLTNLEVRYSGPASRCSSA
jgi:hypothetical protein